MGVDFFVWLDLAVTEVEEGLPTNETPRSSAAAGHVARIALAKLCRVKHHAEERLAVISSEVRPVRRADHRMAKPVGGGLEFDRNGWRRGRVDLTAILHDVVNQGLPDELWQKLVKNQPLVMPGHHSPGLGKGRVVIEVGRCPHPFDNRIVELQEGNLDACNHHVLVVTPVGDDGLTTAVTRQVLEQPTILDSEQDVVVALVELRRIRRIASIHAVEVEPGRAQVGASA